jgi:hypothetical protein
MRHEGGVESILYIQEDNLDQDIATAVNIRAWADLFVKVFDSVSKLRIRHAQNRLNGAGRARHQNYVLNESVLGNTQSLCGECL